MKYSPQEIHDALAPERQATLESRQRGVMPERVVIRLLTAQANAESRMDKFNSGLGKVRSRLSAELTMLQSKRMKKLEALKKLRAAAAEFSRIGTPYSACAKGCTHCCHIPVAMFESEARLMGKALGREPAQVRHSDWLEQKPYGYEHACPFLQSGGCSIYENRPLACRLHLNMDVDELLCELVPDASVPVPLADATVFHAVYAYICQGDVLADIREFFPAPTSLSDNPPA